MKKKVYPYRKPIENCLFLFVLWLAHYLQKKYWLSLLDYFSASDVKIAYPLLITRIQLILVIAVYSCFYYFEFSFIEQFKIDPRPWPWKTDRKNWFKKIRKMILITVFNFFIIGPNINRITKTSDFNQTDLESYPSL